MTVRVTGSGEVALVGVCPGEDAEALLQALLEHPEATVDLRGCEGAHTAVVQVLLAAQTPVRGPAAGAFLRQWVEPLLNAR